MKKTHNIKQNKISDYTITLPKSAKKEISYILNNKTPFGIRLIPFYDEENNKLILEINIEENNEKIS